MGRRRPANLIQITLAQVTDTTDRLPLGVYVITSSGLSPGRDHPRWGWRPYAAAPRRSSFELLARRRGPAAGGRGARHGCALGVCSSSSTIASTSRARPAPTASISDRATSRGARAQTGSSTISRERVHRRGGAARGARGRGLRRRQPQRSTPTKPEAAPQGLDGVRAIAGATALPVVGVGGIDASNAGDVIAAGAATAVVSAVGRRPIPWRRRAGPSRGAGRAGGPGVTEQRTGKITPDVFERLILRDLGASTRMRSSAPSTASTSASSASSMAWRWR